MSLEPCDYYLFGKQHRVSFRIPSTRKPNVLDLVYSDVCDPINVESLGGNKYYVTFIDDASRKVWVYTSIEFKSYCSEEGIRHEKTIPGTPQQNGVAERKDCTFVEKVRCMLRMTNLPKSFWCEAVQIACYLINRSTLVPLEFDKFGLGKIFLTFT